MRNSLFITRNFIFIQNVLCWNLGIILRFFIRGFIVTRFFAGISSPHSCSSDGTYRGSGICCVGGLPMWPRSLSSHCSRWNDPLEIFNTPNHVRLRITSLVLTLTRLKHSFPNPSSQVLCDGRSFQIALLMDSMSVIDCRVGDSSFLRSFQFVMLDCCFNWCSNFWWLPARRRNFSDFLYCNSSSSCLIFVQSFPNALLDGTLMSCTLAPHVPGRIEMISLTSCHWNLCSLIHMRQRYCLPTFRHFSGSDFPMTNFIYSDLLAAVNFIPYLSPGFCKSWYYGVHCNTSVGSRSSFSSAAVFFLALPELPLPVPGLLEKCTNAQTTNDGKSCELGK